MRIRFGHVCLTHFPQRKGDEKWTVDKFNEKVLKNPRILSRFATCLATDEKQLSCLLKDLNNSLSGDSQKMDGLLKDLNDARSENSQKMDGDHNDSRSEDNPKMDDSPFREFKIRAIRKIPDDNDESWPCVFDIEFEKYIKEDEKKNIQKTDGKHEGRIGLWSAVLNEKNVLDISMSCLDSKYSWKLNIQTAKRLSNDKFGAQGNFISKLRICPQGRLVYSNTKEISVVSVCEKTKRRYWWRPKTDGQIPSSDHDTDKYYIVEVTRYEFWDLSEYKDTLAGVEIPLSLEASPVVTYGVTLYKKLWRDEFSFNCSLEAGEVPEWHPHDINDEEEMGSVNTLFTDIKRFIKVLQTNLNTNEY